MCWFGGYLWPPKKSRVGHFIGKELRDWFHDRKGATAIS